MGILKGHPANRSSSAYAILNKIGDQLGRPPMDREMSLRDEAAVGLDLACDFDPTTEWNPDPASGSSHEFHISSMGPRQYFEGSY